MSIINVNIDPLFIDFLRNLGYIFIVVQLFFILYVKGYLFILKAKLKKLLFSKTALAVFTSISVLGLLLGYSVRHGYVFVDAVLFEYASFGYYIFAVLSTVYLFVLLCLKMRNKSCADKKSLLFPAFIGEVNSILLLLYFAIALITDSFMSLHTVAALFKNALPVWAAVAGIAFFLFIFPALKSKDAKKAISVCTVMVLVLVTYASFFPVSPYKFTSGPVVIDNGNGGYSVVFSTNDKGTGYIDYSYNGNDYHIYDESNGRKEGQNIIHTITVPKEHLSGNTYKVGSVRVIDELSYGGRLGKTIESDSYTFNDSFGSDISVLTVSDWHTFNEKAEKASEFLGDYQAVVLLGDCAPGLMSEEDIADYILKFGFDLTQGSMPVIYTRGNHETRGREAINLSDYLGIDSFYFTANVGDYNIIVLDSCEDKEDEHPEYGGMVDYEQYRTNMVKWLNTLENTENQKTITFCHSREICIEEDLADDAMSKLDSLNTSFLVSGHEHIYEFDGSSNIPVLVDGGIDANGKGTFVASMLDLSPDGIKVRCADNSGKILIDETVQWK